MVPRVSTTKPPEGQQVFSNQSKSSPLLINSSRSTLQSLNPLNIFSLIYGLIRGFFEYLFSFFSSSSSNLDSREILPSSPPPSIIEKIDALKQEKVDEGNEAAIDPFVDLIYDENTAFRNPEVFKETSRVFEILGTNTIVGWFTNKSYLDEREEKFQHSLHHPMEFIYYIFYDKQHLIWVNNFQKEAESSSNTCWLNWMGRYPWKEFLEKYANKLKEHQNTIPQYIPGFSGLLGLDVDAVTQLAKKQKWEQLILYIFEERKKQFSL